MNITRLSAAAAIVAATLGLAACGSDESEQPTEAKDQPTVDLEAAPENASWSSVGGDRYAGGFQRRAGKN